MAISTAEASAGYPTLISAIWPEEGSSRLARNVVLAILGAALLTVSAKVQMPFYPVPMTMQSYVVLVIGMAYGWRLAGATLLLYLAEGAIGLPVFASGGGYAYFAGPTAGYLVGFLVAATAIGWLAEKGWDRNPLLSVLAMALGTVVIFALGVAWLAGLFGFETAVANGLQPFLFGAAAKLALAAATVPIAWRVVRRYRDDS